MNPRVAKASNAWILVSFGALLTGVFLSTMPRGLVEDGYFVKRFAYNFWHHGAFAWNPSDGPIYGITSQTLQLLATLLYALDSDHLLLSLKGALSLSLFGTLLVVSKLAENHERSELGLVPAAVGLSLPLVLEMIPAGLETVLAMCAVALAVHAAMRFDRKQCGPWPVALTVMLVYLTRPDATLVPVVLAAVLAWPDSRQWRQVALLAGSGLALMLLVFHAYYGAALPLSFYVKTLGITGQATSLLAIYAAEKITNAGQAVFFGLPFVYVALHERTRLIAALLVSSIAFASYHYLFTVEVMGHLSRFYLPALIPLLIAAVLAYPAFLRARHTWRNVAAVVAYLLAFIWIQDRAVVRILESWHFYPFMLACSAMLLARVDWPRTTGALIGATLWASALCCYPVRQLSVEDDTAILLRQIAPRLVFRGLADLRERLDVRTLFHTDMGAPGVLFPEARVVDLDGLLNEDITLRHMRFEDLCRIDKPDAIFVPKKAYAELRREVLASQCIADYQRVDADRKSPLRIRKDLVARWRAGDGP